jgi:hypothetical protein
MEARLAISKFRARARDAACLTCAALLAASGSAAQEPVLAGDPSVPDGSAVAEILPFHPYYDPGRDGKYGTDDDAIRSDRIGDIDLVVRVGAVDLTAGIPDPTARAQAPTAVAEPFGQGTLIPFVVFASDGDERLPYGRETRSPGFDGSPVIVAAFADLDGDGFVGVTNLDGNASDNAVEAAELEPIARQVSVAGASRASGALRVTVGGPAESPLRVLVTAATYIGEFDPDYFGGVVPKGPAVLTQMPLLPDLDPDRVLEGGPKGPPPPRPGIPLGVTIEPAFAPGPRNPAIGESFTLRTDGREATVDVIEARSGRCSRFAVALSPGPDFVRLPERPLRRGLTQDGRPAVYAIPQRLAVADDGAGSPLPLRVVPLDRTDDVCDLDSPREVEIETKRVRIVSPDSDGDPFRERLTVTGARGAAIALDDSGGRYDEADNDVLWVRSDGRITRIDIAIPDPDVDDSGTVDARDLLLTSHFASAGTDFPLFRARFDVDGNGVINGRDVDSVAAHQGERATRP